MHTFSKEFIIVYLGSYPFERPQVVSQEEALNLEVKNENDCNWQSMKGIEFQFD